jgi:hypothetical protein
MTSGAFFYRGAAFVTLANGKSIQYNYVHQPVAHACSLLVLPVERASEPEKTG